MDFRPAHIDNTETNESEWMRQRSFWDSSPVQSVSISIVFFLNTTQTWSDTSSACVWVIKIYSLS